jgi:hypothetical protein
VLIPAKITLEDEETVNNSFFLSSLEDFFYRLDPICTSDSEVQIDGESYAAQSKFARPKGVNKLVM